MASPQVFNEDNFMEVDEEDFNKPIEYPSLSAVVDLISQERFKDDLSKSFLRNFAINGNIEERDWQMIKSLRYSHKLMMTFQSTERNKFFVLSKTNGGLENFKSVDLSAHSDELRKFIVRHVHSSLANNGSGLLSNLSGSSDLKITSFGDENGFNLLMMATAQNRGDIVKELISLKCFDVNHKVGNVSAIDLAWNEGFYDIVLDLLNANSLFPFNFYLHVRTTDEIHLFTDTTSRLHDLIINHRISQSKASEISQILEQNLNLRHFFDFQNQSAAFVALEKGKFDLYELLGSKNVVIAQTDSPERIKQILQNLSDSNKLKIRDIHQKCARDLPKKHILRLLINSFVGLDDLKSEERFSLVWDAFETLDKIEEIQPILELVSHAEKFKFLFDFHRDSVQFLDPTGDKGTNGLFYINGLIFVAAKSLLDKETRNNAIGVLAHEICHFDLVSKIFDEIYSKCNNKAKVVEKIGKLLKKPEITVKNINNVAVFNGMTLLNLGIERNYFPLIKFLHEFGIDFCSKNFHKETILEAVCKKCDGETLNLVLGDEFQEELRKYQAAIKSDYKSSKRKKVSNNFKKKHEALQALNEEDHTLLMIAAQYENIEAVNLLLSLDVIDVNHKVKEQTAASIAWERKSLQIFYQLLLYNAEYPENFSHDFLKNVRGEEWADKIYVLISEVNELHALIKEEEIIEKVKELRVKYPNLKHFHNVDNISLMKKLNNERNFEISDMLSALGLTFCPHESLEDLEEEIIEFNVPIKAQPQLKEGEKKVHQSLPYESSYIKILEANAHFIASEEHPHIKKSMYFKIIQKILRFLENVPMNVHNLKLLAAYNHKKVIFDFSATRQKPCSDNKKYLNRNELILCCGDFLKFPLDILTGEVTYDEAIRREQAKQTPQVVPQPQPKSSFLGRFMNQGPSLTPVYQEVVSQKAIQIPPKKELLACFASVAHELMHWSVQLVYENHCKPHAIEDVDRRKKYERVVTQTVFNEKLAKDFENPEDKFYHAEVMARLTHILTLYRDDPMMVNKSRQELAKVFEFYTTFVFVDIERASRTIFGVKKVEEINAQLGVEEIVQKENLRLKNESLNIDLKPAESNVVVISSNSPSLVLSALFQIHSANEENRKYLNSTVTNILQGKAKNEPKFLIFASQVQIFIKDFREPILEAFKSCEDSILILYCKKSFSFTKLFDILKKLDTLKRIIFVTYETDEKISKEISHFSLNYDWYSLTDDTKERLFQKKIKFQDRFVETKEIFKSDQECDFFLEYLINEESLMINNVKESTNEKMEVDPQNIIPRYIERNFIDLRTQNVSNLQNLVNLSENQKIIILSDVPGSGKSTTFKKLTEKLSQKYPSKWISLIEMSQMDKIVFTKLSEVFEQFEVNPDSDNRKVSFDKSDEPEKEKNSLLRVLAKYCLKLSRLERKIFDFLFTRGDVILLFDAFDQVPPKFDDLMHKLFKTLKSFDKNQIWISTREDFLESFDIPIYKFKPLEIEDKAQVLDRAHLMVINNFDHIQEIGDFLKINLIKEIEPNFLNKRFNIFELFETFFERKHKIIKSKSVNYDTFMNAHELLAIEEVFGEKLSNLDSSDRKELSEFGIILLENKKIKFSHRSFAEFISARLLINLITNKELKNTPQVCEYFIDVLQSRKLNLMRKFLDEKLQSLVTVSISSEFANMFLTSILSSYNSSNILKNLINDHKNLFELVNKLTRTHSIATKKMWVEDNDDKSVLLDSINGENFEFLWDEIQNFKYKNLKFILSERQRSLLLIIAKKNLSFQDEEKFEEVSETDEKMSKGIKTMNVVPSSEVDQSSEKSAKPKRVSCLASKQCKPPSFPECESSTSQHSVESSINSKLSEIFIKFRSIYTTEEYSSILKKRDEDGHSALYYAVKNNMRNFISLYLNELGRFSTTNEIAEILKIKIVTSENPLYRSIVRQNVEVFKILINFYGNYQLIDVKVSAIFFIHALINSELNSEIFNEVRKILTQALSKDEFHKKVYNQIKTLSSIDKDKKQKLMNICENFLAFYDGKIS